MRWPREAGDTVIWHPLLPNGGGEIRNFAKSRFSFVMHTTPVGVPVRHHDRFFDPAAPAAMDVPWDYGSRAGRFYVERAHVDFAHQEIFGANTFKQPS